MTGILPLMQAHIIHKIIALKYRALAVKIKGRADLSTLHRAGFFPRHSRRRCG